MAFIELVRKFPMALPQIVSLGRDVFRDTREVKQDDYSTIDLLDESGDSKMTVIKQWFTPSRILTLLSIVLTVVILILSCVWKDKDTNLSVFSNDNKHPINKKKMNTSLV